MWKFRPIGKYYELLIDGDSIYLCREQDTIIQAVLENLCNLHNTEVAKYEYIDTTIADCDAAYLNGLEDGRDETNQERYDAGYKDGHRRGVADALGRDEIK